MFLEDKRKVNLAEANLFGRRDDLEVAFKDAISMIESSCRNNAAFPITALMLVWNTLAVKYDIYEKDVAE